MALIAASGLALATILVTAVRSTAQDQVSPLPIPSQQPTDAPARPIVGGHDLQPDAAQLQDEGVPAPTRQQTQEIDRLEEELLKQAETKSGADDE
jgi:hypothetical protein